MGRCECGQRQTGNSAATSSPNFSFASRFPPYTSIHRNSQTQEGGGGAGGEALLRLPRVALAQPWHQDHHHYQDLASSSSSPTSLPISSCVPSLFSFYSSSGCPALSKPSCPPQACHHHPCPNVYQGKQGVYCVCSSWGVSKPVDTFPYRPPSSPASTHSHTRVDLLPCAPLPLPSRRPLIVLPSPAS